MFVETIRSPAAEYQHWDEQLRFTEDPPAALVANIAWAHPDGTVSAVHVWDTPEAIGDFYLERARPVIEAEGEPTNKPRRYGEPVHLYLRERRV